ncbi:hypothetical protein NQ315_010132 [Exocentrus adspersus]|uniref:Secreted RxLR effector peptide protein n=1 Tax=Exocentrus adspersus TaxID=1586481 RepID=A0AAV8WAK5_9CUCU|nr:hypothetical protein NQ315_010132 [Exocentrus adspersus]
MKAVLILGCFLAVAMAQRPSFAGTSAKGLPELASRFKDTSSDSASSSPKTVVNRIGESSNESLSTAQKLPVDARGDAELVDRLNQWPRENRPFWLLNAEQIEKHRDAEGKQEKQKQYH